jgi:hypothetical protein
MLLLTPTMLGSLLAGVALWLMFWYGVNHVDSIPYLHLGRGTKTLQALEVAPSDDMDELSRVAF